MSKKVPVLGVCVGFQIMAKSSEEGSLDGLGWINATVKKFDLDVSRYPLPHMGWNEIEINKKNSLVHQLPENPEFYFLHSYYVKCENQDDIIAQTKYDKNFVSLANYENIYGCQPHPEKSHQNGIRFLQNFGEL